jgi:hypothetical protein
VTDTSAKAKGNDILRFISGQPMRPCGTGASLLGASILARAWMKITEDLLPQNQIPKPFISDHADTDAWHPKPFP